jgi:hypothetical protein
MSGRTESACCFCAQLTQVKRRCNTLVCAYLHDERDRHSRSAAAEMCTSVCYWGFTVRWAGDASWWTRRSACTSCLHPFRARDTWGLIAGICARLLVSAVQREWARHRVRPSWIAHTRHEGALLARRLLGVQPPLQLLQGPSKSHFRIAWSVAARSPPNQHRPLRPATAMTVAMSP